MGEPEQGTCPGGLPAGPCTGVQPCKQSSWSKNNPSALQRSQPCCPSQISLGWRTQPYGAGKSGLGLQLAVRRVDILVCCFSQTRDFQVKTDHSRSRRCSAAVTFSHMVQTSRQKGSCSIQHPHLQAIVVISVIVGSND